VACISRLPHEARISLRHTECAALLEPYFPRAPATGPQLPAKRFYLVAVSDWSLLLVPMSQSPGRSTVVEVPLLAVARLAQERQPEGSELVKDPRGPVHSSIITVVQQQQQQQQAAKGEPMFETAAAVQQGADDNTSFDAAATRISLRQLKWAAALGVPQHSNWLQRLFSKSQQSAHADPASQQACSQKKSTGSSSSSVPAVLEEESSWCAGDALRLLTLEHNSSLFFHVASAWRGAHMRAALAQAGAASQPIWAAPGGVSAGDPACGGWSRSGVVVGHQQGSRVSAVLEADMMHFYGLSAAPGGPQQQLMMEQPWRHSTDEQAIPTYHSSSAPGSRCSSPQLAEPAELGKVQPLNLGALDAVPRSSSPGPAEHGGWRLAINSARAAVRNGRESSTALQNLPPSQALRRQLSDSELFVTAGGHGQLAPHTAAAASSIRTRPASAAGAGPFPSPPPSPSAVRRRSSLAELVAVLQQRRRQRQLLLQQQVLKAHARATRGAYTRGSVAEARETFRLHASELLRPCTLLSESDAACVNNLLLELAFSRPDKVGELHCQFFTAPEVATFLVARLHSWGGVVDAFPRDDEDGGGSSSCSKNVSSSRKCACKGLLRRLGLLRGAIDIRSAVNAAASISQCEAAQLSLKPSSPPHSGCTDSGSVYYADPLRLTPLTSLQSNYLFIAKASKTHPSSAGHIRRQGLVMHEEEEEEEEEDSSSSDWSSSSSDKEAPPGRRRRHQPAAAGRQQAEPPGIALWRRLAGQLLAAVASSKLRALL